jgi:chemotaxis protein methyltransferase CheR
MTDQECVAFLQWTLPQLGMRWLGFRKVRRQVHKRINRRLGELGLSGISDYRAYLHTHPAEWLVLDGLCRISISRFYRDRGVFDRLRDKVLPELARMVTARNEGEVRSWCAGCASGEEVYTLAILWSKYVQPHFPQVQLRQVATDTDEQMLQRACQACYPASSLKDAPLDWLDTSFTRLEREYTLNSHFHGQVEFRQEDIRTDAPAGSFHLVLCRNLVFTYFVEELQRAVLQQIIKHMVCGAFLVIGKQENLPESVKGLLPYNLDLGIYRIYR